MTPRTVTPPIAIDIPAVLGAPLTLPCGVVLPNRIAKAAMSEGLADAGGDPSDALVRLYERLGAGGAGLVITGNVMVTPDGCGEPGNVVAPLRVSRSASRHDAPLERYREWAEATQRHGAIAFVQIDRAGRQSPRNLSPRPVAPSEVPMTIPGAFGRPRALEDAEIEALIDRFADTAELAQRAGWGGVQLHGAHGYLISQFLSPLTNLRADRWGGSLENRMRFVLEIYRRTRARCGPRFPIAIKLNSADFLRGGFDIEQAIAVARALSDEGIDLIEISGGTYERPAMIADPSGSSSEREAHFREYARRIVPAVKCPVMLTGGLRTPDTMARVVAEGDAHVVGLARPIAIEPELPREILAGRTEAAHVARAGTSIVAAAMDTTWYQLQLHRVGRGLDPDEGVSRWRALWTQILALFRRPKMRRGLPRQATPATVAAQVAAPPI